MMKRDKTKTSRDTLVEALGTSQYQACRNDMSKNV